MRSAALWTVVVLSLGFNQDATRWQDPSPHSVRFVPVDDGVRLEVLDWGGSGPPLVLLGCYLSAHVYDDFAPKLADQFHVYGITRRGIGPSDKPESGYSVSRSVSDVLAVLDALDLRAPLMVGTSCAGQVMTLFASRHAGRLSGLVYFDGASDPTMTSADVGVPMPDPNNLPRRVDPPEALDRSSFAAYRDTQGRRSGFAFPEAALRTMFAANPDGSVGHFLLSPVIRRAITIDARLRPDYSGIRVPVLALYQKELPFAEVASGHLLRNESERVALRQQYDVTRALYTRWQEDLLAQVPEARIVEITGASLYMFLSHESDVLREIRTFARGLAHR